MHRHAALLALLLYLPPLAAEKPIRGCGADRWADFDDLEEQYKGEPELPEIQKLRAYNGKLCADIRAGRISEEQAAVDYDRARDAWLEYMQKMIIERDQRTRRGDTG